MLEPIKNAYGKVKGWVPAASFVGGCACDWILLHRIDNPYSLSILAVLLAVCFVLVFLIGRKAVFRYSRYVPSAAHFCFGALLSPYTVFYFKSAASLASWIFMLALAALLIGNEFLEKKLHNATVSFCMFGLCSSMYFTFLVPILVKRMGFWVFLLSLLVSAAACLGLLRLIRSPTLNMKPIGAMYAAFLLMYVANIIPPVPLSLKDVGVYRSVAKEGNEYVCTMEEPRWYQVFRRSEKVFRYRPGDEACCFASVFAPTRLKETIYHHWYVKAPGSIRYAESGTFGYQLVGGRDAGYRGFTCKSRIAPGRWMVRVTTSDGKVLGIARFSVKAVPEGEEIRLKELRM